MMGEMATKNKKSLIDIVLGEAPLVLAEINKEGLLLNLLPYYSHMQSWLLLIPTGKCIQCRPISRNEQDWKNVFLPGSKQGNVVSFVVSYTFSSSFPIYLPILTLFLYLFSFLSSPFFISFPFLSLYLCFLLLSPLHLSWQIWAFQLKYLPSSAATILLRFFSPGNERRLIEPERLHTHLKNSTVLQYFYYYNSSTLQIRGASFWWHKVFSPNLPFLWTAHGRVVKATDS